MRRPCVWLTSSNAAAALRSVSARQCHLTLPASAPPPVSQERQASGQLFKGFFEKSNEALYEEPPASQQPAVDPAAAEATEALLRELERRERPGASLLHSRGVRLALAVGLLAVVLAAAARGAMRMGLGQLLPRWLPLG